MTFPTEAAQVLIAIIPVVAIVAGSIVIFFFLRWRHQQQMKMIEMGIEPPSGLDLRSYSLAAGLISSGVGFVLTVFLVLTDGPGYSLLGGLIPLAVGISLLAFYLLRQNEPRR